MTTTRKLTRIKAAATLFGALSVLLLAPATAYAVDNEPTPGGGGGCTYADADGYEIPIDDGQTVFVDGKLVTCKGGQITVTTAPKRNVIQRPIFDRNAPVLTVAP
ncbi:hypothetical protein ABGB19_14775 [Mycobacterium sp. B14F4]|uniref:hypothetical protein n=1 Tax=Mycobacterium sp. B14F4 TaxID=3153565 RepID=UPI00325F4898